MTTILRMAVALSLAATCGCATAGPRLPIHESAQGAVYLERVQRDGFEATHPVALDPTLLAKLLAGIVIDPAQRAVERLRASEASAQAVFAPEEIAFLAPWLSQALKAASAQDVVVFHVRQPQALGAPPRGAAAGAWPSGPTMLTTAGRLYVYGRSVIVTLTEYRHAPERPDTIHMPNRRLPDPTGLAGSMVRFTPQSALRPEAFTPPEAADIDLPTLVIDYGLLERLPRADALPPAPSAPPTPDPAPRSPQTSTHTGEQGAEQAQAIKDLLIKKELELERLRQEVDSLRGQLRERDAQIEQLKSKRSEDQ